MDIANRFHAFSCWRNRCHFLLHLAGFFYRIGALLAFLEVLSLNIGVGYHRLLSHRSFETPKWIEYFLAACGASALEGGPVFWVATHRIHHQFTDKDGDPHKPRDGKWWGHIGWILVGDATHRNIDQCSYYAPDIRKDRFLRWLSKYHYVPLALLRNTRKTERGANQFLIQLAVRAAPFALLRNTRKTERGASQFLIRLVVRAAPFALLRNTRKTERGASQFLSRLVVRAAPFALLSILLLALGGLPFLLWGVFFRVTVGLHATWMVNSLTHFWGSRRFATRDASRNNWFVAMLSFGEGWHNNHHANPTSARHGLAWYEIDMHWWEIRLLQIIGLATSVRRASLPFKLQPPVTASTNAEV